jgi:hypothetical protein
LSPGLSRKYAGGHDFRLKRGSPGFELGDREFVISKAGRWQFDGLRPLMNCKLFVINMLTCLAPKYLSEISIVRFKSDRLPGRVTAQKQKEQNVKADS